MAFKPVATRDSRNNIEMERVSVQLIDIRAASTESPGGGFDALAQLWAPHTNDWGEQFTRGCFAKSLQERVYNARGSRCRLTDAHIWTSEATLGTVIAAEERTEGLWVNCTFASTADAQSIRTKMMQGHLDEFSIEFRALVEDFLRDQGAVIRVIKEAMFWGLSVLPYSSQGEGTLLDVRSPSSAGAPYQDLPMAPADTPWDPAAAHARVSAWAKGEGVGYGINFARFRRAFLAEDMERRGTTAGYGYQVADVINGQLAIVPRALMRAAAALMGDKAIDTRSRDLLQAHMDRYFERLPTEGRSSIRAPWGYGIDALILEVRSGGTIPAEQLPMVQEAIAVLTTATTGDAPPPAAAPDTTATPTPAPAESLTAGPAAEPPTVTTISATSDDAEARASASRQQQLREAELRFAELGLADIEH